MRNLNLQRCFYVHPDNVEAARRELDVRVAAIARPDAHMSQHPTQQIIVETERGVHLRCYLTEWQGIRFLVIYGRFNRVRTTSADIDFELTQEALSFLGVKIIVGHFVVGSILEQDRAGTVYVPDDYIGFGGFNKSRRLRSGFRNVDSFVPFCPHARSSLVEASAELDFPVMTQGVYASFHGYPRIETAAELKFYESAGCSVVGQTIDPEATLAREAGCHYAALAATIDDGEVRSRFLRGDVQARTEIEQHTRIGRERMFSLFVGALPRLHKLAPTACNCEAQGEIASRPSGLFYYRPRGPLAPL